MDNRDAIRRELDRSIAASREGKRNDQEDLETREREYRVSVAYRDEFLESCQAIPCPPEAYALWLGRWLMQHGKISSYSDRDLSSTRMLMATRSTDTPIPAGYGALSISLLTLSNIATVPTWRTSGDTRSGWEYGHSTLMQLDMDSDDFVAKTNQSHVVCYRDVEQLIRRSLDGGSMESITRQVNQRGLPRGS